MECKQVISKTLNAFYNHLARLKLKNKDFSIISNSCWGGVVYHKLKLPFLSPFINLDFDDKDFYKLAANLRYYMSLDLQPVHGLEKFPTAYLGDILLRFVHYKTDEEAFSKWEERKNRIKYDNLFFLTSDRPNGDKIVQDDDTRSLKDVACKGRVVFTVRDIPDCDYLIRLPKDESGDFVNIYMLDHTPFLNRWQWEYHFDYIHWLNTGIVKQL